MVWRFLKKIWRILGENPSNQKSKFHHSKENQTFDDFLQNNIKSAPEPCIQKGVESGILFKSAKTAHVRHVSACELRKNMKSHRL
jgi:hypothetical protein